ncbi:hypothetical protein SPRG_22109 [Saprolegnia parasitica CBS 223.65]|uniref:Vesicle tethering protein Uso1/P115-like head domain-containing protein n=1 Tax=Saprolegnia parasitica (strain CBS 223.65) TaxID=695850 RepID=A0A067D2D6_SAPPC|nr:hypothetical protein SPRG_22109 [Saprolegnia parasitica CBS 223.65]KDO32921.1 hypothetical protein SPRG_22109 [Saprolegnia parasitica CBS 223.65]|eukprot:XP_012196676.1 hypothetical protein SPRG_22109 [Saprolegnia parasitica CBS 223.65]
MQHLMKKFVQSSLDGLPPRHDAEPKRPPEPTGLVTPPRIPTPPTSGSRRHVAKADVTTAIEGFQYAMLLAERKASLTKLQALWDTAEILDEYHALLLPVLLNALVTDPRDTELMEAMLELMQALMTMRPVNATLLLNEPNALREILNLMTDPSPWIRGPTVQLIKRVQDGDVQSFASHILDCHEGLRLLLDVVEDKREHIRDTAIQILLHLITNQSTMAQRHIQQFLAFEDGFARLFQIVDLELEGHGCDSAVLVDCLQVLYHMVHDNVNSQYLLCQTPFIAALFPLLLTAPLALEDADEDAPTPAIDWTLRLLHALIGPVFQDMTDLDELAQRDQVKRNADIPSLQSYLAQQPDVISAVAELAAFGTTADRVAACKLLEAFARDHEGNQLLLLTLPLRESAYFVSSLLRLDLHHEETALSVAATRLVSTIWSSPLVKISLLQHIAAPPHHESGPITPIGQELIDILESTIDAILDGTTTATIELTTRDAIKVAWKAMARWRQLIDTAECREFALRIPMVANTVAVPGGLFLNKWLHWLCKGAVAPVSKAQYPLCVGLFRVLLASIVQCPRAVAEVASSVPTLTFFFDWARSSSSVESADVELTGLSAAGMGKKQFLNLVTDRVGLQRLTDCFTLLQQSDALSSARRPDGFAYPLYDKPFGTLFKHIAEKTRSAILSAYMGDSSDEDSSARAYQDLIRMQDAQLTELRRELEAKIPAPSVALDEARAQIDELRRQQEASDTRFRGLRHAFDHVEAELAEKEKELALLRGHAPEAPHAPAAPSQAARSVADEESSLLQLQLQSTIARLERQCAEKDDELAAQQAMIDRLTAHKAVLDAKQAPETDHLAAAHAKMDEMKAAHTATVASLVVQHEQALQQLRADCDLRLQEELRSQGTAHHESTETLHSSLESLELEKETMAAELDRLRTEVVQLTTTKDEAIASLQSQIDELRAAPTETTIEKGDGDLLLLLGSLEVQYRSFRDVVETELGPAGVEKALRLSEKRGALHKLFS